MNIIRLFLAVLFQEKTTAKMTSAVPPAMPILEEGVLASQDGPEDTGGPNADMGKEELDVMDDLDGLLSCRRTCCSSSGCWSRSPSFAPTCPAS